MSVIDDIISEMILNNPYNKIDNNEITGIIEMLHTMVWCDCNKCITPVSFFTEVMNNEELCEIVVEVCGFENVVEFALEFAKRYPKIVNSKTAVGLIRGIAHDDKI